MKLYKSIIVWFFRSYFIKLYRRFVLWIGDIHTLQHFPFISWDITEHKVSFEELQYGLNLVELGDIGLHRDENYLSNLAIPGAMKHAWLFEGKINTIFGKQVSIIEAISEGVLKRSAIYPMRTDYCIILRPKVSKKIKLEAVRRGNLLVGCQYDVNFKFDLEKENEIFENFKDKDIAQENMKKYNLGFSCTEVVAFSYIGNRTSLGLFRKKIRGKQIITPDAFISTHFDVIWCSNSLTIEAAKKLKMCEEGIEMITNYWNNKEEVKNVTI